jgi:hypothetical protein
VKILICIAILIGCNNVFSQQGLIPIHSFYKDQLFANKSDKPYNEGSFFPVCESQYDLITAINDSSKQYYDVTQILFKQYLIEVKGKDYYLKISPAIDFTMGRDLEDTLKRKLFQNTRGLHVEGNLFKNFAFSTSLYENQSRNTHYESNYYSSLGELYPQAGGTYQTQNAVIPGGGRTKEFKVDGFDYAFAVGYFVYQPFKWLNISAGNNALFIGDGHRSVLLSDNSYSAPYYRIGWKISPKFSFTYLRSRHLNLMRRPASGSVESYYEAKGFSVNYFTFKPTKKISVSLFESGVWNRGDSITSTSSHPLYYNPIPFVSGLALEGKDEVVSLLGINANYQFAKYHRVYGQIAMNDLDAEKIAFQLGYRGYNYFGLKDFMFQLEYNNVANKTYESANRRLNYVHYNLPVAHVKGNGFQEFLVRTNYEFKRLYAELSLNYYITNNYSSSALLPVYGETEYNSNNIFYENLEIGYRFNRKMNLMLFGSWTYRTINDPDQLATNYVSFGLKTGFINHYKDF